MKKGFIDDAEGDVVAIVFVVEVGCAAGVLLLSLAEISEVEGVMVSINRRRGKRDEREVVKQLRF